MVAVSKALAEALLWSAPSQFQDVASPALANTNQYNIDKYLFGAGPYIEFEGYGISTDLPEGAELEQAQILMRHGERFPGLSAGKTLEELVKRLQGYNGSLSGPLEFLTSYDYKDFVPSENLYEYETTPQNSKSPYTGYSTGTKAGASFRQKYGALYHTNETLPLFVAASARVLQTAQFFARGFFGNDYSENNVLYNVISENATQGFNTLTPRWGCKNFNTSEKKDVWTKFDQAYQTDIVKRLTSANPGLNITAKDVPNLFNLCAYELSVRGGSDFCGLFTQNELVTNSYYNDLYFYNLEGQGNSKSQAIGYVQLNATLALLKEEKPKNKLWISFTHDTDMELYHAALGLFDTIDPLPNDRIAFTDVYHHVDVIPMGARIITEKFKLKNDSYVRFIVNDAVVPLRTCNSGPGFSCSLSDFEDYFNDRFADFNLTDVCEVDDDEPSSLTFYWDYPGNKAYNITAPRIVN